MQWGSAPVAENPLGNIDIIDHDSLSPVYPSDFLTIFIQGKFYLFVEVTSQLHRQLAPIQVYTGPNKGTDT